MRCRSRPATLARVTVSAEEGQEAEEAEEGNHLPISKQVEVHRPETRLLGCESALIFSFPYTVRHTSTAHCTVLYVSWDKVPIPSHTLALQGAEKRLLRC